ncbi:MAG: hypothetical protein A2Y75_05235 [Candidatus Solincola sediminis]|uniref:Uncharacterized protein n=1 Tax=Candidatus Solincola sediminis TaxID=1797199 RepID=A0A1F2WG67_9ACTN|nr:MAG: hypothetical protein A2Y75_05235 [Candidatus Solincola sediminis]
MIIGYGKIGRSMPLSLAKCGTLGGDVECAAIVNTLARRHPDDTFILLGRNSGERPSDVGMPANVINPWIEWQPYLRAWINTSGMNHANLSVYEQRRLHAFFAGLTEETFVNCDAHVWWLGQHGTTNMPIPKIGARDVLTKPHDWCAYYVAFALSGINAWRESDPIRREEIYLNADPRNWPKMRDLKWPLRHSVLAQYDYVTNIKHERYSDTRQPMDTDFGLYATNEEPGVWRSTVRSVYSGLEINGLFPGTPFGDLVSFNDTWENRDRFGLFINESGKTGNAKMQRVTAFEEWIAPQNPNWVHGKWSDSSLTRLGRSISPAPWDQYFPRLHSVRATFTTPSSCSPWATTKPWEAFAAGTVCFFHPEYDKQNHILRNADPTLQHMLRVKTPAQLASHIDAVNNNRDLWKTIVRLQREHFDNAMTEHKFLSMIEERIYGA